LRALEDEAVRIGDEIAVEGSGEDLDEGHRELMVAGLEASISRARARACYRNTVVRRHRRFELLQVTLDETPIGSCTIDAWEDDDGREQWTARVLMKTGHGSTEGILHGSTRSGEPLAGQVRFAADQQGPRGGRTVLVELHGQGPLEPAQPLADPVTAEHPPAS
jgi:hypothetical protein